MHQTGKITSAQSLLVQHELGHSGRSYGTEFAERLKEAAAQAGNLQFSRHASLRMEQRGIELTGENLQELSQAVERARQKGSRETVVIGSHGAFIVNVANNVVVTSITEQEMKQNIFTNIDSAVFM